MSKARRAKPDWFMIALPLTALAACLWPTPGVTGGPLHWDWISTYGVCLVFFLYGLTLAPEKMKAGASNWRLHLVATAGTFVLFPLLVLGAGALAGDHVEPGLLLGFFFLAALPSTISSSVAMTSLARGNLPAAIFNATFSSLIGVLITPLMMAWYTHSQGTPMQLGPVLLNVVLLVVVPIVLGQLVRPLLSGWATRHHSRIKLADRAIILAIVYGSFADSMASGIWSQQDPIVLVEIAGGVILLFGIAFSIMWSVCRLVGFDLPDTIAATFCGSKKSLATGVPMARLMFGTTPQLGLVLAPVMVFHFFQLMAVSVIAGRLARRPMTDAEVHEAQKSKAEKPARGQTAKAA
jgi:sodium/bile acid cotransporter 7